MNLSNKIILITGVSSSGKTTLQENLMKDGWTRPINFTTRKPRNDKELDEYVFLTRNQFLIKLGNGDFLEFTQYNGNFYGVGKNFQIGKNISIILEPLGKLQVMKEFLNKGISFKSVYLEIPERVQQERLTKRGVSTEEMLNRKKDYNYFFPMPNDIVINGKQTIENVMREFYYKI